MAADDAGAREARDVHPLGGDADVELRHELDGPTVERALTALKAAIRDREQALDRIFEIAEDEARATDGDDERASTSFSIVPADAEDGLRRYRAVLAPLFLAGGFLHVPDLFGAGPISGAFDASSLGELSPGARALTALWAVGGPAAAAGLATGSVVGDVGVTCVASAEIIVGLDFPSAIAPAEIPGPIVAAQTVNLASLVGLRAWQTAERRRRAEE